MQKLWLYLVLSLALIAPLSATTVTFNPPWPESGEAVRIRIETSANGCIPDATTTVNAAAREIEILFETPAGLGCPTAVIPFEEEVVVDDLAPGTWTVLVYMSEPPLARRKIGERSLVVSSELRGLEIEPRVIPAGSTTTPWISLRANRIGFCAVLVDPCPVPSVLFNGSR